MEEAKKRIGGLVKAGREQKGWTVYGAAKRTGMTSETWISIEKGGNCTIDKVLAAMRLVGINEFKV